MRMGRFESASDNAYTVAVSSRFLHGIKASHHDADSAAQLAIKDVCSPHYPNFSSAILGTYLAHDYPPAIFSARVESVESTG